MPTSNQLFSALALVLAATSAVACGSSAAKDDEPSPDGSVPIPSRDDAGSGDAGGPKAPPVKDTPDASEFNETLGFFVTPNGKPGADGTRERPLDTIQAGIERGKAAGKRVYVCSGTYHEALTLADSISVIGGLDCSNAKSWKSGSAKSRVEAAASPAVHAKDITSPTRIEGLDVVAPDVTEPSASSIGLLADHSAGLTIAKAIITAGNAANGADGVEGVQLTLDVNAAHGTVSTVDAKCENGLTCTKTPDISIFRWKKPAGVAGGVSICAGAPNHNAESGGAGGSGGLYEPNRAPNALGWTYYAGAASFAATVGEARVSISSPPGAAGANPPALGALTSDGYVASNGAAGTNGGGGFGGFGGNGRAPRGLSTGVDAGEVWRGLGGASGGAGGCPGLAGTPGTGGGASIAVALVDSPLVIDDSQLVSHKGGTAGRGTLGSDGTLGGEPGASLSDNPADAAGHGGRGTSAGISTNGSSGPSAAMLSIGAAPKVSGSSKLTPGNGGDAIPAASYTDPYGDVRTIPATAAGQAKDKITL